MYVVACSWRVVTKRTRSSRSPASAPYSCTPGRPNTTFTPSRTSCLASASPPVIRAMVSSLLAWRGQLVQISARHRVPGVAAQRDLGVVARDVATPQLVERLCEARERLVDGQRVAGHLRIAHERAADLEGRALPLTTVDVQRAELPVRVHEPHVHR